MNMTLSSIAIAEDCKSKGSQMFDEGQWWLLSLTLQFNAEKRKGRSNTVLGFEVWYCRRKTWWLLCVTLMSDSRRSKENCGQEWWSNGNKNDPTWLICLKVCCCPWLQVRCCRKKDGLESRVSQVYIVLDAHGASFRKSSDALRIHCVRSFILTDFVNKTYTHYRSPTRPIINGLALLHFN